MNIIPVVVFNCSTNVVGGGIQNSVNFINQIFTNGGFGLKWYFLLSPQVYAQVKDLMIEGEFYVAHKSPASSLVTRKEILHLIKDLSPNVIYTSAGPAYIDFPGLHIMGCSNPYILGAPKYAYKLYGNVTGRIKRRLKTIYQQQQIKKANVWIAQTEASEKSLRKVVGQSAPVYVIYNSVSADFLNNLTAMDMVKDSFHECSVGTCKKILVPTSYYQHKDLEKVPEAISLFMKKYGKMVEVTFTIQSPSDYEGILRIAKKFNVENYFRNIGAYAHKDALEIYKQYDVILQPSALEVFSTSYIESMATLKPLVVPSFDFAKSICRDYAHYYFSENMISYADALNAAIQDDNLEVRYEKAINIVLKYGSQESRVNKIISLIEKYLA